MAKVSAKTSDFLKEAKKCTSTKIYSLLVDLVNEDREHLAKEVLRIDYLLEYASNCIKQKDFREARESLSKAKARIDMLKEEGSDTEYLDYLYEGISKKIK
jgi:hypothetical protein